MKLFSTPYYCPKCKEKLNLQWDFDPSKVFFKCVECGTWLEHEGEKAEYKIYKGKHPGDSPYEEAKFDSGDMDDDFFDSPSNTESGEHGKVTVEIAPFAKDEIQKEDEARADEAIAKYESVLDPKEADFEEADFGATSEADESWEKDAASASDFSRDGSDVPAEAAKEKAPDPTRKKGWTWPWGKKAVEPSVVAAELPYEEKEEEDPEDQFQEEEIPEEVDVDWDEEMREPETEDGKKKGRRFGRKVDKKTDGKTEKRAKEASNVPPAKEEAPVKKSPAIVRFFRHIFKHKKVYLIVFVIVAALSAGYAVYHHLSKMVAVGFTDEQACTMNYEEVIKLLEKSGYTNIETIPLEDLQTRNMDKENIVDMISIRGDTDFTEKDRFEYDSEILIQYHSAKMIKMPLDPKKVNEKTVKELENLLQKAGFEKISVEPHYDLIFGLLHKEGDVENITVNGSTKFTELQAYRIDTEIVITYHDFKKNDTKK